ncbi:MAG: glycerate kinase [Methyloprofundus sp.]|nr:glycerate kinase [Methyloprofundus sp.]
MTFNLTNLRKDASDIFQSGILAADPYQAVKQELSAQDAKLIIQHQASKEWQKIHLIAVGKAACSMAKAAQEIIPPQLLSSHSLAITNTENAFSIENTTVLSAGHPLPDQRGLTAANQVYKIAQQAKENELVLILLSGGGSALLPYPAGNISLEEKITITDLLLSSGATINELNCVRKHLSRLKGGQLAKLTAPAELHTLILSDVLGDDLSTIASGPTVPDPSSFSDAKTILEKYSLWEKAASSIKQHLEDGIKLITEETPKKNAAFFRQTSYRLISSNIISLNAITSHAKNLDYTTEVYSTALTGEAKIVAEDWVLFIKQKLSQPTSAPLAFVAGGETTVTIQGSGLGGRNQEMALAFAIAAEKHHLNAEWVFLSGGTDGRDGPTDAAGGIVDTQTFSRLLAAGIEPETYLANNNSYYALKESQDLLVTGATGTNVADLQILLIQPNL